MKTLLLIPLALLTTQSVVAAEEALGAAFIQNLRIERDNARKTVEVVNADNEWLRKENERLRRRVKELETLLALQGSGGNARPDPFATSAGGDPFAAPSAPVGNAASPLSPADRVASRQWRTLLEIQGVGDKTSQRFVVGQNWRVRWTSQSRRRPAGGALSIYATGDHHQSMASVDGDHSDVSYGEAPGVYQLKIIASSDMAWALVVEELHEQ